MSKKIRIFYFLILVIVCSCSSDNSTENNPNLKKGLLKSVDSEKDGKEEFEYENGYLTKVIPNTPGIMITEYRYEYNNKGKLIASITLIANEKLKSSYSYDTQNRLIKVVKEGTADYSVLEYFADKIIVKNHIETALNKSKDLISEVYIDNNRRIIKTIQITPSNFDEYLIKEFKYDSNGNIIKVINRANTNQNPDLIFDYEYDNKKSPEYLSYKYHNESLYYWMFSNTNSIIAMSPNNIISIKSSTSSVIRQMTYNEDNFPINIIHSIYQGSSSTPSSTSTKTYKYYE
ncbi:hypothetical protein [Flavobacterium sp. LHD-85]|uniref:hypothetical protein n=1 Tax=Flavobacterium sp. LHD-85 TaxID=3071410 RepID=UPI0027E064DB|nr:hypothetical protein [Flavobacterium sp. LHD-85]MDQ6528404.1 hypothetical protein [Flavobacterium sp. LHD-85]